VLLLALSAFLITAMALTGSRGPILAVALGVPVAAAICGRRAWLRTLARLSVLGGLALLLILAGRSGTQLASIPRLDLYFATPGANSSDTIRLDYWRISLRAIEDSYSLGEGTGDFAVLVRTTGREYPHNVILEVWVELGILGLFVLTLLLVGAFRRIWHLSGLLALLEPVGPTVGVTGFAAIVFFSFLNASVSGDIPANYQLWISLGVVWLLETKRLPGAPEALSRSASPVLVGV
jgi:O-antigen ligase